jgi:cell division septation protein DedD
VTDEEFTDDELRAGLTSLSPAAGDVEDALARLRPRARRARARRRAAIAGGVASVVLLLGVAGAVVLPDDGDDGIDAVDQGSTTTTERSSSTTSAPTTTSTPTTVTPDTAPPNSAVPPDSVPPQETTVPTTPTANDNDVEEESYSGNLGAITVRRTSNTLALVATNPQAGATTSVEDDGPDRIRVDFEGDSGARTRIEVRLENGEMVPDIQEN